MMTSSLFHRDVIMCSWQGTS